jgi:deoxyribose-phosphate aldolase
MNSQTEMEEIAALALSCLDLTNLREDCDEDAIRDLCERAQTKFGPVAAVCVWPQFVALAHGLLSKTPVKVATVVNFPSGQDSIASVREMAAQAVTDGADEIDVVIPWAEVLEGRSEVVAPTIRSVRSAAQSVVLKAILETGMLENPDLIREAADQALSGGVDFLKTSSGKASFNATPKAARILLEAIKASGKDVGIKPSGGIKTTAEAAEYIALAREHMGPDWVTPQRFRIGGSRILDDLLTVLGDTSDRPSAQRGY